MGRCGNSVAQRAYLWSCVHFLSLALRSARACFAYATLFLAGYPQAHDGGASWVIGL